MAAGIWSGMLTFGLVTLPVHLVAAVRSRPTALTMLHRSDFAPLERRMVCPEHDRVIKRNQQVRGFRISENEFVVVTEEELEKLAPDRSQAIEIERFVDLEEISPLYFDRPYFLVPDQGADKPYWLLVRALEESARAGIASFVMKERQHLVTVISRDQVLVLVTLHYQRQIVDSEGLAPDKARVPKDRLSEMLEFIADHERDFDSESYRDIDELALLELAKKTAREQGVKSPAKDSNASMSGNQAAREIGKVAERIQPENEPEN